LEAHKMSGTPILGIHCEISVMDPGSKALMKKVWEAREQQPQPLPELDDAPHPLEAQGVQAEYFRKFREAAEDKRLRTVHIAGLANDATEDGVRFLIKNFGEVEELRVDADNQGQFFALVEFREQHVAYACKAQQQFIVDGRLLTFSEAKTLVDTRSFAEKSVHFHAPIFDASTMRAVLAYQCHLNPKLARARKAAAEMMNEPVPPETEAILKAAEDAKKAAEEPPEPVAWPGRSERDPTQWPWRQEQDKEPRKEGSPSPDSSKSSRRKRSSRSRSRRRRRDRKRRRGDASRSRSRSSGPQERGKPRRSRGERQRGRRKADEPEACTGAIDLDDDDIAVVPNTEMLVLGDGASSGSDEPSQSPLRKRNQGRVVACFGSPSMERDKLNGGKMRVVDCTRLPSVSPARSVPDSPKSEGETAPQSFLGICLADLLEVLEKRDATAKTLKEHTGQGEPKNAARLASAKVEAEAGRAEGNLEVASQRAQEAATEVAATETAAIPSIDPAAHPWECGACGEPNKASRRQCNNCGGRAPWVKEELVVEDDDDASSTSSSTASPGPVQNCEADSPLACGSPARSVQESPARSVSIAASGSARSVAESEHSMVDLDSEAEKEDIAWEADRIRGDLADARARIFFDGPGA